MKNKKGWLRIVEAFVAITLITGVLLFLYSGTIDKTKRSDEVYNLQKSILDEVSFNDNLRNDVLNNNPENIKTMIQNRVQTSFNFEVKICSVEEICNLDTYQTGVYSSERVISSNLTAYQPKKLKLFMWLK